MPWQMPRFKVKTVEEAEEKVIQASSKASGIGLDPAEATAICEIIQAVGDPPANCVLAVSGYGHIGAGTPNSFSVTVIHLNEAL